MEDLDCLSNHLDMRERELDAPRRKLLALVKADPNISLKSLSVDTLRRNATYLQDYLDKGSPKELRYEDRQKIAAKLGVDPEELTVKRGTGKIPEKLVATTKPFPLTSSGEKARGGRFEELSVEVPVIGSVQAGAWMEAIQLPESEWTFVSVPADLRYPGVPRLAWKNLGNSMNKRFEDGATLVCIRYEDASENPQPGDYVIVEREDVGGRVEATCKRYRVDSDGKQWLDPESTDARWKPLPVAGDKHIKEIRVLARVLNAINIVGGRL